MYVIHLLFLSPLSNSEDMVGKKHFFFFFFSCPLGFLGGKGSQFLVYQGFFQFLVSDLGPLFIEYGRNRI